MGDDGQEINYSWPNVKYLQFPSLMHFQNTTFNITFVTQNLNFIPFSDQGSNILKLRIFVLICIKEEKRTMYFQIAVNVVCILSCVNMSCQMHTSSKSYYTL